MALIEVRQTAAFLDWLRILRDHEARKAITRRIRRIELGLLGDVRSVGDNVSEVRIDFGPGYRVYFRRRGDTVIILLCAGDKGSQVRDIARAKDLAAQLE